ncbi:GNAT family N-acetyltransferase [Spirochaeta isovalerica]|uniref:RimJ/RimL family protein N-acetyltransferase n=1 Tax=Spirochaeta isovalerica TaxID=150 RepID=A0A841RGM9_9SPIO|nr:GNAT family N-acetyltransferase [Spirochaeta isovalerica]MBB6482726.1 RimJ/RimL family protein N-acetyltransferase [Spirochaeta isovalerica]
MTKTEITYNLPQKVGDYYIREANSIDHCIRANWPDYPDEYVLFNSSSRFLKFEEQINKFRDKITDNNIILSVLSSNGILVGHFSILQIDWKEKKIGNMGIRIHPNYCNKGVGSLILEWISNFFHSHGFLQIKLDVLSSNKRAIRCYEKVGFRSIENVIEKSESFTIMQKIL